MKPNEIQKRRVGPFEYSWKTLAEITGEKPTGDIFQFVKSIDYYPWFKQEFNQWGMIFSSLWVYPPQNSEPLIYKLISQYFKGWKISEAWQCEDGFTPKVYPFAELAFRERSIFILDEDVDYLKEDEARLIDVKFLNIGSQFLEDSSRLLFLQAGWGFNGWKKSFR